MKKLVSLFIIFFLCTPSIAENDVYKSAAAEYEKNLNTPEFIQYQDEFIQFNNYHKLDTINKCYTLDSKVVNMIIVISKDAVISEVIGDEPSMKFECLKHTYLGVRVKKPPYDPFYIKMVMN